MNMARKSGLNLLDIDRMDISYLMDMLIDESNAILDANKPEVTVRKATQADYDML